MSIIIETSILNENLWQDINLEGIINTVKILMEREFEFAENSEISLMFCDDEKIQELNKTYRNKDKATNVLSFAFNDDGEQGDMLGDVCFSFDTIAKEAKAQNKIFEAHLTHLLIHGILHLIGFDHIYDDDCLIMEQLETELLDKINIANPYKTIV